MADVRLRKVVGHSEGFLRFSFPVDDQDRFIVPEPLVHHVPGFRRIRFCNQPDPVNGFPGKGHRFQQHLGGPELRRFRGAGGAAAFHGRKPDIQRIIRFLFQPVKNGAGLPGNQIPAVFVQSAVVGIHRIDDRQAVRRRNRPDRIRNFIVVQPLHGADPVLPGNPVAVIEFLHGDHPDGTVSVRSAQGIPVPGHGHLVPFRVRKRDQLIIPVPQVRQHGIVLHIRVHEGRQRPAVFRLPFQPHIGQPVLRRKDPGRLGRFRPVMVCRFHEPGRNGIQPVRHQVHKDHPVVLDPYTVRKLFNFSLTQDADSVLPEVSHKFRIARCRVEFAPDRYPDIAGPGRVRIRPLDHVFRCICYGTPHRNRIIPGVQHGAGRTVLRQLEGGFAGWFGGRGAHRRLRFRIPGVYAVSGGRAQVLEKERILCRFPPFAFIRNIGAGGVRNHFQHNGIFFPVPGLHRKGRGGFCGNHRFFGNYPVGFPESLVGRIRIRHVSGQLRHVAFPVQLPAHEDISVLHRIRREGHIGTEFSRNRRDRCSAVCVKCNRIICRRPDGMDGQVFAPHFFRQRRLPLFKGIMPVFLGLPDLHGLSVYILPDIGIVRRLNDRFLESIFIVIRRCICFGTAVGIVR